LILECKSSSEIVYIMITLEESQWLLRKSMADTGNKLLNSQISLER
jgi:hypothetical protein